METIWPPYTFNELKNLSEDQVKKLLQFRGLKKSAQRSALWCPYIEDFDFSENSYEWIDGTYEGVYVMIYNMSFGGKFAFYDPTRQKKKIFYASKEYLNFSPKPI
jgi:hypothetical protein